MNLCFAFFIFEGGKKNNKQTKEEEKNLYITACTRLNAFVHSNEQHFFFGLFFFVFVFRREGHQVSFSSMRRTRTGFIKYLFDRNEKFIFRSLFFMLEWNLHIINCFLLKYNI